MAGWLIAGQPVSEFWPATPFEVGIVLRAAAKARLARIEEQRALNHELATLIAWAFHAPKNMPAYERTERPEAASEADEIFAMHYLKSWAKGGG